MNAVGLCVHLLDKFADLYKDLPSYNEIFQAASQHLARFEYLETAHLRLCSTCRIQSDNKHCVHDILITAIGFQDDQRCQL